MELQLFGLIIDFLGTILLLLFLDPVATNRKLRNGKEKSKKQIAKRYLIKRRFALIIIALGFIVQVIAISYR